MQDGLVLFQYFPWHVETKLFKKMLVLDGIYTETSIYVRQKEREKRELKMIQCLQ
jgi:hypothetical protein